jgi:O-Antigen ligase
MSGRSLRAVDNSRFVTVLTFAGVALIALTLAGMASYLGWVAVAIGLGAAFLLITLRSPLHGLFLVTVLCIGLEPQDNEPITHLGWLVQSDISSWTPARFVNFSPIELLMLIVAIGTVTHLVIWRSRPSGLGQLRMLFVFLALMVLSVAWGLAKGGDPKISLWETRSLFLTGLAAVLASILIVKREHLLALMDILTCTVILLSIEIIWRRHVPLEGVTVLDTQFAHETPVFMNAIILFLLARLMWATSPWQRLTALFIPLIVYAEMLTERRAGWIGLDAGIIFLAVLIWKLRPRTFRFFVLPLGIVYLAYIGAFWNASTTSSLAQPARAVHSIFAPDPRDAASNVYRYVETANIRLNIHADPILGLGFGREFTFYYPMPDLSFWPFWHYTPHNAFLWVWMKMGAIGFIAFLSLIGIAVLRGTHAITRGRDASVRPALIAMVGAVLMLVIHSYVDLGLTNVRSTLFLGLALGIISSWSYRVLQESTD